MSNDENIYEEILLEVDSDGKFQKCFNIKYNLVFTFIGSMTYLSYILLLAVPRHWCYIPGRNHTEFSMEEWKMINIPWDTTLGDYSRCTMFNTNRTITKCLYGIQYDDTWYKETVVSKENWVCQDAIKVTHAFEFGKLGEMIGTITLGSLGDKYGRRTTFYICTIIMLIGRISMIATTSNYSLFLGSLILGSLTSNMAFQALQIIYFEITKEEKRSLSTYYQCVAWTMALCALPMIYWFYKTWIPYLLWSTLPVIVFFVFRGYMIESPRWLAGTGQIDKSLKQLKTISRTNKTILPTLLTKKLKCAHASEKRRPQNMFSLFSNRTLAKITVLSMISWGSWNLSYGILYFNATNLYGNPFMNFFWQGFAELPGYFLGKYFSDLFGRKFSRMVGFSIGCVGSVVLVFVVPYKEYHLAVNIISIILKFAFSMGFYVICLHTLEFFPTNFRQSGVSMACLAGNITSLFAPYAIYMSQTINHSIPYIITSVLGLTAAFITLWLPETLNQKLPETIEELETLNHQKLWPDFMKYKKCDIETNI